MLGQLTTVQKLVGALLAVIGVSAVGGTILYFFPTVTNHRYAPEQPLPFSHKQHAGDLNIDCRYCHAEAANSIHATVPSVGTCMNCHDVVAVDSPHIQKIHEHYENDEPIEWIRVYELPDHARFNHARHVQKGVSCEECHGDVKKMDRIVQDTPLTMGWCLTCHRGHDVPSRVKASVREAKGVDEEEDIFDEDGNLAPINCSTCHY